MIGFSDSHTRNASDATAYASHAGPRAYRRPRARASTGPGRFVAGLISSFQYFVGRGTESRDEIPSIRVTTSPVQTNPQRTDHPGRVRSEVREGDGREIKQTEKIEIFLCLVSAPEESSDGVRITIHVEPLQPVRLPAIPMAPPDPRPCTAATSVLPKPYAASRHSE